MNKKSNCSNTVSKFFHPSIEKVEKLNFYDPNYIKESLFSCNNLSSKKFSTDDADNTNLSNMSKNYSLINIIDLPHLKNHMKSQVQMENENNNKRDRIKNIKLENELEAKRRLIKLKIQEKKEEINETIKMICDSEKEIGDLNLDLELQIKYGKQSSFVLPAAEPEKLQKKPSKKNILQKGVLLINSLRVFFI